jgi:hypothetical protein
LTPFLLNASTPALRDLTDPLATAAIFGFLIGWLRLWNVWTLCLFAAAAVFGRETNVAVVGLALAATVWMRDWPRAAGLAVVLLGWIGWAVFLGIQYGALPFATGGFDWPFAGIYYRLAHLRGDAVSGGAPIHAVGLAYVGALALIAVVAMPICRANAILTLTALMGALMAICGSSYIFMDGHSYTRVFIFLPLGILLWGLQSGRVWPLCALAPALLWPAYALAQVWLR